MQKMYTLCVLWDDGKEIKKQILLMDTLENIDKFILNKKYNSSEDIRNDKIFKIVIDSFIKSMETHNKHFRGDIVITEENAFDRISVMYKPRVDLAKNFVKLMSTKMKLTLDKNSLEKAKEKEYTKRFIGKYRNTIFTERESVNLFTALKYNYKTLFNSVLLNWKQRYIKDNPNQIQNLRFLIKTMGLDMKIRIEELLALNNKNTISDNTKKNMVQDETEDEKEEYKLEEDDGLRIVKFNKSGNIESMIRYNEYLKNQEEFSEYFNDDDHHFHR